MPKNNRIVEAFKENANMIGIASAVALSVALLNPAPLLAAVVAEAAYLLFVPDSKWYAARLARRYDAEIDQRRQKLKDQTLPLLRPQMQQRFLRLEEMRAQIDTQCKDDETWFREVLRKLDYLLEKFLLFASKEVEFRSYLEQLQGELQTNTAAPWAQKQAPDRRDRERSHSNGRADWDIPQRPLKSGPPNETTRRPAAPATPEDWIPPLVEAIQARYQQECEQLRQSMEAEPDEATRSILGKRADILQRRNEFVGKMGKILFNLDHQLQLVEDTFGLINDEIRARSPEQILADVEEVVVTTDTMASTLQELASVDQMMARIAS